MSARQRLRVQRRGQGQQLGQLGTGGGIADPEAITAHLP
jgi:hypothetical protein